MRNSKIVGIDLGTSNSVLAIKSLNVDVLENSEGELLTPSCVYFNPDVDDIFSPEGHKVGRLALNWLKQAPLSTVTHVKRLMGRTFDDEAVQTFIRETYFGQKIKSFEKFDQKNVMITISSKESEIEVSPEEVSSLILKKIKQDGERQIEGEISNAVITVPAYFNDKQKHATQIAAQKAGLNVLRLLPESTAAAIAFGIEEAQGELNETILVYDFGGGTLDISVLTVGGGQYVEQAKGGNMWLGGSDIDNAIFKKILQKVSEVEGEDFFALWENLDESRRGTLTREVLEEAEKAKIKLSKEMSASVQKIGIIEDSEGIPLDIDVTITREEFNQVVTGFLDQGIKLITDLLKESFLDCNLIDRILLVGGSAQIPLLREKLETLFNRDKIILHPRPMLAIAEGAAILAHKLQCSAGDGDVADESALAEVLHTAAHDYYLDLEEGADAHLLMAKHTPLPAVKKFKIELKSSRQKLLHLSFSNKIADDFENIGHLWPSLGTEFEAKGKLILELEFKVSEDNLISVTGRSIDNTEVNMTKSLTRGKEDEIFYLRLQEQLVNAHSVDDYYCKLDFEYRLANVIPVINKILDPLTEEVLPHNLDAAQRQLDLAQESLDKEESLRGNIYYLERFLSLGETVGKKGREKELKAKLKRLKKMYFTADFQETLELKEQLFDQCSKYFPERMRLMGEGDDCDSEKYDIETSFNML